MPRLYLADPYDRRIRAELEEIERGLSEHFARITQIDHDAASRALRFLVGAACKGAHVRPIVLAREFLVEADRQWLCTRLALIAESELDLDDEWEYRRLLELCDLIDDKLLTYFIARGLSSTNPEVLEAAEEFQEKREGPTSESRQPR